MILVESSCDLVRLSFFNTNFDIQWLLRGHNTYLAMEDLFTSFVSISFVDQLLALLVVEVRAFVLPVVLLDTVEAV